MTHHSRYPLGGYQGDDPPPNVRKAKKFSLPYLVNLARSSS